MIRIPTLEITVLIVTLMKISVEGSKIVRPIVLCYVFSFENERERTNKKYEK